MAKHTAWPLAAALTALMAVSTCDVSAKDVGDASLRTLVATLGAGMFKEQHHPIDGELACRTEGGEPYRVSCTGKDTDGRPVTLVVEAKHKKDVSSRRRSGVTAESVVGTVDGTVVFSRKCLGSAC
ncbi:hypothetical protein [Streptomyces fuscigenes]|uniref:hypothetical protein n=1 Tax=Streptomyces fuscigenes TaxID=1528880 RepID=UPI001F3F8144|nr:hypothetical protein [Streptomyces fuscigenes]MCF3960867.1 hypothetical protein [Streptomyces fuscigenes]